MIPLFWMVVGMLTLQLGCASYSERLARARRAVDRGRPAVAIDVLNEALHVESRQELPQEFDSNTALGLLERGSLLHMVGDTDRSARDWIEADRRLEVLELTDDPVGTFASYIYSESVRTYRLFPTEKLALNTLGMLNFLVAGNLSGARVEARRFTVARRALSDLDVTPSPAPLGAYLAGFVFEHLGESNEALRYYDEALASQRFESLAPSLARLARRSSYRGRYLEAELDRDPTPPPEDSADLLVVVSLGRVPHKVPERMPIGAAIGLAGAFITGDLRVLERSALKVVVYPELASVRRIARDARVRIDDHRAATQTAAHYDQEIRIEYEDWKPRIIGAALSRLVARAAVAEGARFGIREASGSPLLGWLSALLLEGTLVALDEPDTRSWSFLPGEVLIARRHVRPGDHMVQIEIQGIDATHRIPISVDRGGFAVVSISELR